MNLEFRLLGDLAVLADGHPLELGGTRQRSVLALLVLQRNRSVATELLADRLWPDDLPLSAIKTIQVYVSRLRHALGPDAARITSTATGYRLSVADDELDAARFERGLRRAREALAAGPEERSLAILEEAQAEALQCYQDARRYLTGELGLEPSTELRALELAILPPADREAVRHGGHDGGSPQRVGSGRRRQQSGSNRSNVWGSSPA